MHMRNKLKIRPALRLPEVNSSNLSNGFTLVELLIVIAIIGILAAIVLSSLGTARDKARDGDVKAEMSQVALTAALYHDTNGNFGTYLMGYGYAECDSSVGFNGDKTIFDTNTTNNPTTGATMKRLLDAIHLNAKDSSASPKCYGDGNGWALTAILRTSCPDTGGSWCVDGDGFSGCGTVANGSPDSCQ